MLAAQLEALKALKKAPAKSADTKKQPPKKGAKAEPEPAKAEDPNADPRAKVRVLTELPPPFKAENFEYRMSQMMEVEDLKHHLASSNLNVSIEAIRKAVLLPEEAQGLE